MNDLLADLLATQHEIERPWAAFTGLIEVRPSFYAKPGDLYALNPTSGFSLNPTVVLHPDTLTEARAEAVTHLGRSLSDAELAAWLWWLTVKLERP